MKIAIVKTSALGDIIHAFPALSYLRLKFPAAQIDWVVEESFAELVSANPQVDNIICVNTRSMRKSISAAWKGFSSARKRLRQDIYDVVFDFQGNIKSGLIVSQLRSPCKVGFGRKTVSEWPNCLFSGLRFNPPQFCNVREESLFLVQSYFGDKEQVVDSPVILNIDSDERIKIALLKQHPVMRCVDKVMVCPGSAWRNKQATTESLTGLLVKIHADRKCGFLFVWGSEEERRVVEALAKSFPENSMVVEKLCLPTLQNLMRDVQLVVAMDSLPLHLAGTVGVATLGLFGPSSAQKYMPVGEQHSAFQGECPYERTFVKRCPVLRSCQTGACLRDVSGEQFYTTLGYKSGASCECKPN